MMLSMCMQIKEDEPRLAKQTRVLQVPVSELYTLASNSSEATGANDVIFRFMPDAAEVASAMAVCTLNLHIWAAFACLHQVGWMGAMA